MTVHRLPAFSIIQFLLLLLHQPDYLNLVSSDFYVFPKLKGNQKGKEISESVKAHDKCMTQVVNNIKKEN
jgi:hypothetical protein